MAQHKPSGMCRCVHQQIEIEKTSKRVLEAEAKRRLRKELEFAYQTQGYETNYDIEVWNINEWYLTKY